MCITRVSHTLNELIKIKTAAQNWNATVTQFTVLNVIMAAIVIYDWAPPVYKSAVFIIATGVAYVVVFAAILLRRADHTFRNLEVAFGISPPIDEISDEPRITHCWCFHSRARDAFD